MRTDVGNVMKRPQFGNEIAADLDYDTAACSRFSAGNSVASASTIAWPSAETPVATLSAN